VASYRAAAERQRAVAATARPQPARPSPRASVIDRKGPAASPVPVRPPAPADQLTARELEVARLIADGYTNREIASALVIEPGTASNHVLRILRKLGAPSRAAVAAWVTRQGLDRDRPPGRT
jgi:DNA-binding NarL/FixJ family response regulator